jgi:hypothetical protein
MGTITGQSILDDAWEKANDPSGVRFSSASALKAINAGQRAIVSHVPKAYTKRVVASAAAGTRQDFAGLSIADGVEVVDIPRNYNAAGSTPGRALTKNNRQWFDENRPTWHSETATEAMHWFQDEQDPKAVYIYPAITGGGKLEVVYAAMPTDLSAIGSAITLDDIYALPLQWFLLFSFYSKDIASTKSQQYAAGYMNLFLQSLGVRDKNLMMAAASTSAKAAGA